MGFSLKRGVTAAVTGGFSETARALSGATRADSPGLPAVPNPYLYGDVPDFTPEEKQFIQQRRQLLSQATDRLNAAPTSYDTTNDAIAQAEQQKYLQALNQQQGKLSVQQQQARQQEFQRVVEAAGRRGIRILGTDPSTATSNSTAGIQMLSEFNKRYDALGDQQRLADLNFGYTANTGRLGLINQQKQDYLRNNALLGEQNAGLQDVYGDQRTAQYNRSIANTDTKNQFLTNTYNRDANQALLAANARNQTKANRLGLVNSLIGGGATLLSGGLSRSAAAPAPAV